MNPINLEGFLDFDTIRNSDAKSLRDYIRRTLFGVLDLEWDDYHELANETHIPYETLEGYKKGNPLNSEDFYTLHLAAGMAINHIIPVRPLNQEEKEKLRFCWRKRGDAICDYTTMEELETMGEINKKPLDMNHAELQLQSTIVSIDIADKLDNPDYDVLVP